MMSPRAVRALALLAAFTLVMFLAPRPPVARAESDEQEREEAARRQQLQVHVTVPSQAQELRGTQIKALSRTVVNFGELARQEAMRPHRTGPIRVLDMEAHDNHVDPLEPEGAPSPELPTMNAPTMAQVASPGPTNSYIGLDDIPMQDSLFIIIPPDCNGAVGLTKVMQGLNNNYRIQDKATGAVISTVGTATFWAPSGETDLLGLTDPHTVYDPINNRWITVMQTISTQNFLVGVSQTSDPSGSWFLYRFNAGRVIDFPLLGFNKNWICVTINSFSAGGAFRSGQTLILNYPQARAGTLTTGNLINQGVNSHFCSAPVVTMSATEDTLFVLTHISSGSGTYTFEYISGTAASPVYHVASAALTRPGGGWAQPGGQTLPQSAPNSGASACGATPCLIESNDSQIRTQPMYRNGYLYYAQTIGLPAPSWTHTAAQWTKLNTSTGAFVDGGRIEDPTATSTNGGKWYRDPAIAVNAAGDFMVGFSQFSSAQHPSAGYSMHLAADAAGTLRDPFIYKAGEDYYHKDFGSGRNRWGDFSQANVDPSDDQTLWSVQEYSKNRTSTDDGTSGANGSKWSTYWAAVNPSAPVGPTVTIAAGPSLNEGNSGLTAFDFTVNLSSAPASAVTVNYATANGTATTADNDYQPATSFITIPAGSTSGVITVNVVGDTKVETNETFTVTLTSAVGGTLGSPIVATGTILNDDNYIITATAGANGSISPSGAVPVAPGGSQTFTIAANSCFHIADVLVDGSSVGPVPSFTFNGVSAPHTISASFAINTFSITASAGTGGSISPPGSVVVNCGSDQAFTIASNPCYHIQDVLVDGVSQGAIANFTFPAVSAAHTIAASFTPDRTLSVGSVVQVEGNAGTTNFDFPLTLSGPCSQQVDVIWKTVDGTATAAGADFQPDSTVVSLAPNATSGVITVHVNGDLTPEDSENFSISLLNPVNAGLGNATGQGTIINDDGVAAAEGTALRDVSFAIQGNPSGAIAFRIGLPTASLADLAVYDISGRRVAALLDNAPVGMGYHVVRWDPRDSRTLTGSGVYFVRFRAEGKSFVKRFVLLR